MDVFFDDEIITPQVKMLKAIVPYAGKRAAELALFIKAYEYVKTLELTDKWRKNTDYGEHMANNIDEIFAKDAFKRADPERLALFREMYNKMSGKSSIEMMAVLAEYSGKLSKGGKIDPADQKAMLDAVYDSLDERDRAKFQNIMRMAENFTK